MRSYDAFERPDMRLQRAQALTMALLQELDDIIPHELQRHAHARLLDLFHKNGASLMTDEDRSQLGLEPRDNLGWTPSERVALERQKIEHMHMIMLGMQLTSNQGSDDEAALRFRVPRADG